ncbi:phosphotransferase [Agrobacterium rhizogenes]|nr:phosphotransferase [Rhizobium rhizogenes]NTH35982.1 phosphotransferase [Rhizobium rhizogenes]
MPPTSMCIKNRAYERSFVLLDESEGPVLCDDDFHQGNVLALRDDADRLQLSGLIDFGNARAASSLFDLAKALYFLLLIKTAVQTMFRTDSLQDVRRFLEGRRYSTRFGRSEQIPQICYSLVNFCLGERRVAKHEPIVRSIVCKVECTAA